MRINVYGTKVCPNCKTVTNYLDEKAVEYRYDTIGTSVSVEQLTEHLGRIPRTVPIIMMDGKETDFNGLKTRLNQLEVLSAGVDSLHGLEL